MQVTYTGITASLKNYGILITATAPDEVEKEVFIDGVDVREFYGCNPAKWMDDFGENENELFSLFTLVNGISIDN